MSTKYPSNKYPDTTYGIEHDTGRIVERKHNGLAIDYKLMRDIPEEHKTKMAVLAIAPDNVHIPGIGIRSDDALSWGVRYIIEN